MHGAQKRTTEIHAGANILKAVPTLLLHSPHSYILFTASKLVPKPLPKNDKILIIIK